MLFESGTGHSGQVLRWAAATVPLVVMFTVMTVQADGAPVVPPPQPLPVVLPPVVVTPVVLPPVVVVTPVVLPPVVVVPKVLPPVVVVPVVGTPVLPLLPEGHGHAGPPPPG